MNEIVLVTQDAFPRCESTFRRQRALEILVCDEDEESLAEEVRQRQCRAVIVGGVPYRGPLYEALSDAGGSGGGLIARFGVGHDGIDKALAREKNVLVANTPGVLDVSVAEHALWLLGSLSRSLPSLDSQLKAGEFTGPEGIELDGKTLAIVGFGQIGRNLARMAHFGLSMRVLAADCRPIEDLEKCEGKTIEEITNSLGVELYTTDIETVLREADFVSLHVPATAQTQHLINKIALSQMKPSAMLINTARGSVVDEIALYDALVEERIAAAALDVFENEPYEPVSPEKDLRTLENVVLTPHTASNTQEANRRMAQAAMDNVANFFAGRIDQINLVEPGG